MQNQTISNNLTIERFLWRSLWFFWVGMILVVTTMPWSDFQGHAHWYNVCWVPFQDTLRSPGYVFNAFANVLLFVPFGYLYLRSRTHGQSTAIFEAALLAILLSTCAELYQVFSHNRFPTMTDVTTNFLGSMIGAFIAIKVRTRPSVAADLNPS